MSESEKKHEDEPRPEDGEHTEITPPDEQEDEDKTEVMAPETVEAEADALEEKIRQSAAAETPLKFTEQELKGFRAADTSAGKAIVYLMTGVFSVGLILYIIVAISVAM